MSEESTTSFENALISAVIEQKDIRTPLKRKIDKTYFFTTMGHAAWQWLVDWYNNPQYPDTPSWESFMYAFPNWEPELPDESIVVLCDQVRAMRVTSDIGSLLQEVADITNGDPIQGLELLKKHTARLSQQHTVDNAVDARDQAQEVLAEYLRMQEGDQALKGRPWPWPTMNESSLGIQNGQLIIIYGRPKTKKTWLAVEVARILSNNGAACHVFSQELSSIELVRRYVALECRLPYSSFMKGDLPPAHEERFFEHLETFIEKQPFIVDACDTSGEGCLLELMAKIDDSRCNAVIIDGAHNLGTWKELYPIIKGLKKIAKSRNIPVIITTHAKRPQGRGEGDRDGAADDMAHSDAFFQECDIAIRVTADVENLRRHEVHLHTAAIREGQPCSFIVNTLIAFDMTEKKRIFLGGEDMATDGDNEEPELDGEEDER